ncbi:hypothetical protein OH76DRAFT_1561110 [Lentinus brumalis]|uniref:Uncharacterized protein n=1 Tax=Lentinus brumalis TaxID=2498619 RepID=A0A371CPF6_9APHY|nr:hypothetical protein OH76DRAFT_1561110 [Polyporus brumalis]
MAMVAPGLHERFWHRVALNRIIELEWAVRNNRPWKTSPKKPRRSGSQSKRERTKNGGRRKHKTNSECDAVPEEGEEGEDDASGKENAEVRRSPGKRRMKSEDEETATPPKKRRVAKAEE